MFHQKIIFFLFILILLACEENKNVKKLILSDSAISLDLEVDDKNIDDKSVTDQNNTDQMISIDGDLSDMSNILDQTFILDDMNINQNTDGYDLRPIEEIPEVGTNQPQDFVMLSVADQSYLLWIEGGRVWHRSLDEQGFFTSAGRIIAQHENGIDFIKSIVIHDIPWIVYGKKGEFAKLKTVDFLEVQGLSIDLPFYDQIFLSQLNDQLLIINQSDSSLNWTFLSYPDYLNILDIAIQQQLSDSNQAFLNTEDRYYQNIDYQFELFQSELNLGDLEDSAGIEDFSILRFKNSGQSVILGKENAICMYIDQYGELFGAFDCLPNQYSAKIIGGQSPYLLYVDALEDVWLTPLFNAKLNGEFEKTNSVPVANLGATDASFALSMDHHRKIFLANVYNNGIEELNEYAFYVIDQQNVLKSNLVNPFAYLDIRAATRRGNTLILVLFPMGQAPRVERLNLEIMPLADNRFNEEKIYSIDAFLERKPQCRMAPERCDGLDNDCDGVVDDGLCCLDDQGITQASLTLPSTTMDYFKNSYLSSAQESLSLYQEQNYPIWMTDGVNQDRSYIAIRVDQQLWYIYQWLHQQAQPTLIGQISGAFEAYGFSAVNQHLALIAKSGPQSNDDIKVFWLRTVENSTNLADVLLNDCQKVLAVDRIGRVPENAKVIVVCEDQIFQLKSDIFSNANANVNTSVISYPMMVNVIQGVQQVQKHLQAEWVTISRHDNISTLTLGTRYDLDGNFDPNLDPTPWRFYQFNLELISNALPTSADRYATLVSINDQPLAESTSSYYRIYQSNHSNQESNRRDTSPSDYPMVKININDRQLKAELAKSNRNPLTFVPFQVDQGVNQIEYALSAEQLFFSKTVIGGKTEFWSSSLRDYPGYHLLNHLPILSLDTNNIFWKTSQYKKTINRTEYQLSKLIAISPKDDEENTFDFYLLSFARCQ
jgi:hypothetical protein